MLVLTGWIINMNKYMIIALRKRAKQTIKKFSKYLEEYNSTTNSNIDFHTFFVDVLNYSEEDYLNLLTAKIKFEKRKKDRTIPKKRQINQDALIKHGIGDIENPEYKKYWDIFTDYNENYLGDESIKGKKCLKQYFIYKYNYSDEMAYAESKKISSIIFKKKKK